MCIWRVMHTKGNHKKTIMRFHFISLTSKGIRCLDDVLRLTGCQRTERLRTRSKSIVKGEESLPWRGDKYCSAFGYYAVSLTQLHRERGGKGREGIHKNYVCQNLFHVNFFMCSRLQYLKINKRNIKKYVNEQNMQIVGQQYPNPISPRI